MEYWLISFKVLTIILMLSESGSLFYRLCCMQIKLSRISCIQGGIILLSWTFGNNGPRVLRRTICSSYATSSSCSSRVQVALVTFGTSLLVYVKELRLLSSRIWIPMISLPYRRLADLPITMNGCDWVQSQPFMIVSKPCSSWLSINSDKYLVGHRYQGMESLMGPVWCQILRLMLHFSIVF